MKIVLTAIAATLVLSGCSFLNVGHENFACSGMPGDPKCMSASQMYQYSINNDQGQNLVRSDFGVATNVVTGSEDGGMTVSAPYTSIETEGRGVKTEGQVIVGDDIIVQNFVTPKLPYSPVPVRTPSMVMRIWIASYTDINGDLNAPGYVYTEIEPRKWIMNPAEAHSRSNFQPLIKKVPVSQQQAQTSAFNADLNRRPSITEGKPATVNNLEKLKQNRSR